MILPKIRFVWIGIFLLSTIFLLISCDGTPPPLSCVDIGCGEHGTCVDGICECTDGFTGDFCINCPTDFDGDGYGNPASLDCRHPELDCDDGNRYVYPSAFEFCNDGIDNQCPGDAGYGFVDEACEAQITMGCFDMGDAFAEGDDDELPVHNVCISAFEMDKHEVTTAEYAACVADGGCTVPSQTDSNLRNFYYDYSDYDNFPVIYVNWHQTVDYCMWAGKRLPTEAEWEYAARGGLADKRYPWGDLISGPDANYIDSGDAWDNDTCPVGSYAPNGYGLYDMAGNVWEWIADWYDEAYYSVSPTNDPIGPMNGTRRVVRGGGWSNDTYLLRVANRNLSVLLRPVFDSRRIGFRCARDVP